MIRISMNLSQLRESFLKQVEEEKVKTVRKAATAALADLEAATPVDTGRAKEAWQLSINGDKATLTNTTDYLVYLNAGSSDQAPTNFIENTVLKYGDPVGSIVTYT